MSEERLQKILARAGVASRRKAEELITRGRVAVDGRIVTELGTKADPKKQRIEVDGRVVTAEALEYVLLHKPRAVVSTTRDPEGRKTVMDFVRRSEARLVPVGRLDYQTSGVLLLTNDGDFANGLLHPSHRIPRLYVAKVKGKMQELHLDVWRRGVELDGRKTAPAKVHFLRHEGDKTWFEITLQEGQNRQIVRMGEATGFPVMRLARLSFAEITADGLRPGQWRHLSADELVKMKRRYGVPKKIVKAPAMKTRPADSRTSPRGRKPKGASSASARKDRSRSRAKPSGR